MSALVFWRTNQCVVSYPPIKVIVVEGSEDITIKISDEGGGIPRRAVPLVWTYTYTTMGGQSIDQDYHVRVSTVLRARLLTSGGDRRVISRLQWLDLGMDYPCRDW